MRQGYCHEKAHIKASKHFEMRRVATSTCLTARTESTKLEYRDDNIQYYWHHIVLKLCLKHLFPSNGT